MRNVHRDGILDTYTYYAVMGMRRVYVLCSVQVVMGMRHVYVLCSVQVVMGMRHVYVLCSVQVVMGMRHVSCSVEAAICRDGNKTCRY